MSDRDDLDDRLDAVEQDLGEPSTFDFTVVFVDDDADEYVTGDGDPVPTDADGEPIPPTASVVFPADTPDVNMEDGA